MSTKYILIGLNIGLWKPRRYFLINCADWKGFCQEQSKTCQVRLKVAHCYMRSKSNLLGRSIGHKYNRKRLPELATQTFYREKFLLKTDWLTDWPNEKRDCCIIVSFWTGRMGKIFGLEARNIPNNNNNNYYNSNYCGIYRVFHL